MDGLAFGASAALIWIMTNLDNLAALVVLVLTLGAGQATGAFLLAQGAVLSGIVATALGVGLVPGWSGYLGVIPVGLGSYALWRQFRAPDPDTSDMVGRKSSLLAAVALFISMSVDSFAVVVPFLADALPSYQKAGVAGAICAILILAGLGAASARLTPLLGDWARSLERIAPIVMIAAGLYVLANTATDLI